MLKRYKDCAGKFTTIYGISFIVYFLVAVQVSPKGTGILDSLLMAGNLWKVLLGMTFISLTVFALNKLPDKI